METFALANPQAFGLTLAGVVVILALVIIAVLILKYMDKVIDLKIETIKLEITHLNSRLTGVEQCQIAGMKDLRSDIGKVHDKIDEAIKLFIEKLK